MKRFWLQVGVSIGTSLFAGAIVSACAHNDASIFIRQVFAPSVPTNGICIFTADPTQPSISVGQADVSFSSLGSYTPELLIGNQIIQQANVNAVQAETSRVIITGAITRITDLKGGTVLDLLSDMCGQGHLDQAACTTGKSLQNGTLQTPQNPFSTFEAGAVEPASGVTASYAAMGVTLVDGATVATLRDYFQNSVVANGSAAFSTQIQLITYTKLEGKTLGGDAVESNEFVFPVNFSYGGLVGNPVVPLSNSALGACLEHATIPTTGQTCTYGQDVPVLIPAFVVNLPGGPQELPSCSGSGDAGGSTGDGG